MSRLVGTVGALYRYPVKSMGGESLERVALAWNGFDADRGYAFVQSGKLVRFPWLTARDLPALVRYRAWLVDPSDTRKSAVRVRTPRGDELPVDDEGLRRALEEEHGAPLHLMRLGRGAHDAAPLSVIGLGTIRALGERAGLPLDIRRFRHNIYLETADAEPFVEERWIGRQLIVGDDPDGPGPAGAPGGASGAVQGPARVRLVRPDHRCMIVNLDPDLGVQTPAVLREIAGSRANCAGLYAAVEAPGPLAVGMPVYLA